MHVVWGGAWFSPLLSVRAESLALLSVRAESLAGPPAPLCAGHFEFVTRMPAEEGEGGEYEERWGAPFNADIGRFGLNSDEKF